MAVEVATGPVVNAGPLTGAVGTGNYPQDYDPQFGPALSYQGDSVPDPRYNMQSSSSDTGVMPCFFNNPSFCMVDMAPAASAATPVNIAAAATVTNGTPMTLVNANSAGITVGIPFVNFATGNATTSTTQICLDFGFDTLNVSSGSTTATPALIRYYYPGMWIVVAISATNVFYTVVTAVGSTTITMRDPAPGTNASAPVGTANYWGQSASAGFRPNAHAPYVQRGFARLLDPLQSCTRGVGINAAASATGGNFTVAGADLYGSVQSEVITAVAASTVYGKKAFKWVTSVTPSFTDGSHTYSVGTSDLFGLNIRSDKWEFTQLFWNASFTTSASSTAGVWTAANTTSPNPNNADPKGTFQVSARGPSATPTGPASNGTIRLGIFVETPLYNMTYATNNSAVPLLGVTPT